MNIDPKRTVAELKELRALTSDDQGAQRVAWTDTWLKAREWFYGLLEEVSGARHTHSYVRIGGVSADQRASLELHRKLGFTEEGRLHGVGLKRGKRLDLALMVLALDG